MRGMILLFEARPTLPVSCCVLLWGLPTGEDEWELPLKASVSVYLSKASSG